MKRWLSVAVIVLAGVAGARGVSAQVPGGLLTHGVVEAGMLRHDFDRTVEFQNKKDDFNTPLWTVALRMGVTDKLSASLELASGFGDVDVGDHTYTVGGSMQTLVWANDAERVTTSIGYTRVMWLYRDYGGVNSQLTQSADWNLFLEKPFSVYSQELTVWAGPTISYLTVQPQDPGSENKSASSQVLGGIVGAQLLLQRHIALTAQGTYISAFESTLLLACRF